MRCVLLLAVALLGCEVKINTGNEAAPAIQDRKKGGKIRNGVIIKTTGGVAVEQAYLTRVADSSLIASDNVVDVNEPVKLNLVIEGWKDKGGKLYLDAEQKVTTSEGDLVLHKKNMFESLGALSAEDAKYIHFQVKITRTTKLFDYFLVEVRAGNTRFDQSVEASFKINL